MIRRAEDNATVGCADPHAPRHPSANWSSNAVGATRAELQELLSQRSSPQATEMQVKVSLGCFRKRDPGAYRLAIEKLDGYEVQNQSFCSGIACVHSTVRPEDTAQVRPASDLCRWCDADDLTVAKSNIGGSIIFNRAVCSLW